MVVQCSYTVWVRDNRLLKFLISFLHCLDCAVAFRISWPTVSVVVLYMVGASLSDTWPHCLNLLIKTHVLKLRQHTTKERRTELEARLELGCAPVL